MHKPHTFDHSCSSSTELLCISRNRQRIIKSNIQVEREGMRMRKGHQGYEKTRGRIGEKKGRGEKGRQNKASLN